MLDLFSTPHSNDIAFNWIQILFDMGPESGFGQAFSVFTSTLGLLGGLFLGWHVIIGIVSSAYSGKVLGERYHQIWAPLRVVLGFGLLIPVAGGFSSVHYVLKEVIGRAAVNVGNAPIVAYIDHLAKNGGSIYSHALGGRQLVLDIIEREVCLTVRNSIYDNSLVGFSGYIQKPIKPTTTPNSLSISTSWDYGSCGSIMFKTEFESDGLYEHDSGFLSSYSNLVKRLTQFHQKRVAATQEVIKEIRSKIDVPRDGKEYSSHLGYYFATKSYVKDNPRETAADLAQAGVLPNDIANVIETQAEKWNKSVSAAVSEIFSDGNEVLREKLAARIKEYGFMMAGSYERDLSKISGMTSNLANATPLKTSQNTGSSYHEQSVTAFNAIMAARNLDNIQLNEEGKVAPTDGIDGTVSLIGSIFPSKDDIQIKNMSGDPVGSMISFGHLLLGLATTAIAALAVMSGGAEGAASSAAGWFGAGIIKGVFSYLSQWISYILMAMLVVGMLHAYVLPMIPMIMVFVMGVSWLIMFLEAAIAGVLWAFAFIRMDGSEFFDRNQAPGVTLIFNLFLRPAIGMLAFIGGLLLLPTLLNTLYAVWGEAFYAQTGRGWSLLFLIQWVTKLVMFCWMQWHLTLRLFGLIPNIADRVGHWMGFSGGHGYNDSSESSAAVGAMVAAGTAIAKAPITPQGGARKAVQRAAAPTGDKTNNDGEGDTGEAREQK